MGKSDLPRLTERTLAVVLAVIFIAPLILTILRYIPVKTNLPHWLDHHWIGAEHLTGVTTPRNNVSLNWRSIMSGAFQSEKNLQFNESFAGREALIRYTNELWFRLFHDTGNQYSRIAVGEHDVLIEKGYLEEYFLARTTKAELAPWVKNLRRLQDYCRSMGMGFVVALVPAKVSTYPENTPKCWRRWYDPLPRACVLVTELFRENGIIFVDAIDLISREKLRPQPVPLFPQGGSHWNQRSALIAANAAQALFAEQGKPAEQIQPIGSIISYDPHSNWQEYDLALLMNLARPLKYQVENISIKPSTRPKERQLTMSVIGDSFGWSMVKAFTESGQFSDVRFFFHYRLYKACLVNGLPVELRNPAPPLDFGREVFGADCLLLEINETIAYQADHHLSAFIQDALANLPDPKAPKQPFRAD